MHMLTQKQKKRKHTWITKTVLDIIKIISQSSLNALFKFLWLISLNVFVKFFIHFIHPLRIFSANVYLHVEQILALNVISLDAITLFIIKSQVSRTLWVLHVYVIFNRYMRNVQAINIVKSCSHSICLNKPCRDQILRWQCFNLIFDGD